MNVADIYQIIDAFAPFANQSPFDKSGLQVGDATTTVSGVLVSVDLSPAVINEAVAMGCNLIVTHHPAIWSPMSAVCEDEYTARMARMLIKHDISYIAAHTNVDKCVGGNSWRLAQLFGGTVTGTLDCEDCAITFTRPAIRFSDLVEEVRRLLDDGSVYGVGYDGPVTDCAVCSGAGGDDVAVRECVQKGYVYLTGEVKHHQLRYVAENNGRLIVFGHFTSEKIFVTIINEILQQAGVRCVASCQDNPCGVRAEKE